MLEMATRIVKIDLFAANAVVALETNSLQGDGQPGTSEIGKTSETLTLKRGLIL